MSLETALDASRPLIFCGVKIVTPFATLRILDGEDTLSIDGETFTGGSDYGDLINGEAFEDGDGNSAPILRLNMQVADPAVISDWIAPTTQGSPVTAWLGAVDRATGIPIADPEVTFRGELDRVSFSIGRDRSVAILEVCSYLERFFDMEEGVRMNDAWHQSIWPGEKGLDQITGINRHWPWGIGGGGTAFKGARQGHTDYSKGFSPLTRAVTRAMGGAGYIFNPAITWGETLGRTFNG